MGSVPINPSPDVPSRFRTWLWVACGVSLVAAMAATLVVDQRPYPRAVDSAWGIPFGPWLLIAAGAICILTMWIGPRRRWSPWVLVFVAIVAAGMRAPLWGSPIQPGADCHRYLWDGAMVANGVDPYRYASRDVYAGDVDDPTVQRLAREGAATLEQINWKHLRTIYPPVAQAMFWAAYRIRPFSMNGWRVVLLAADVLAAIMVIKLLRTSALPDRWAVLYLWNPLLVWETYLGGHLDLAAAALAMLGLYLLTRRRFVWAAVAVVLAIGVKLWPILLLAFFVGPLRSRRREAIVTAAVTVCLIVVMGAMFATSLGVDSGLESYSRTRFANPGVFWLLHQLNAWLGLWAAAPYVIPRAILATAMIIATVLLARGAGTDAKRMCRRVSFVALLMLLLSPTLYPWYYVAVVPLAAIAPTPAVLAWTILAPLCYWQVDEAREPMRWTLTHAPVWCLLIGQCMWAICRRRRGVKVGGEGR